MVCGLKFSFVISFTLSVNFKLESLIILLIGSTPEADLSTPNTSVGEQKLPSQKIITVLLSYAVV